MKGDNGMDRKEICKKYGFTDCFRKMEQMDEVDRNVGFVKFNIPDPDNIECKNGEGVWGWVDTESRRKYNDDSFFGKIEAILCSNPFNYGGVLLQGFKVMLKCNGPDRPILDPDWARAMILDKSWLN